MRPAARTERRARCSRARPALSLSGLAALALAAPAPAAPGDAASLPPLSTSAPFSLVYDGDQVASVLFQGMGQAGNAVRQFPPGRPFAPERWVSKVHWTDLEGRSARQMADLIHRRLTEADDATEMSGALVGIDEIGAGFTDSGDGPQLADALRLLAARPARPSGEPANRRVILYIAPLAVAAVGERGGEGFRSVVQASRRSGAVFLQMFHARGGRITGPATAREWRAWLPAWHQALGSARTRLHVLFTDGGVDQDRQWQWARQTSAGRAALARGAGAYRLGTSEVARRWLANWSRFSAEVPPQGAVASG